MKPIKLLTYLLLPLIAFGLQSCGDDNEDEPTVNDIQGTWLLTHYSYQYHYLENGVWWDDTKDENVSEFNIPNYEGVSIGKWWDHISFSKDVIDIGLMQYKLPTEPSAADYDMDSPEGQVEYMEAMEKWETSLGSNGMRPNLSYAGDVIEQWLCPYSLKGNKLYIGTLYNGEIEFIGSDLFTLTYKDTAFDKQGEYKLYVYTYKRNS